MEYKSIQRFKGYKNEVRHLFNTCWTRDPFEAKYRYGVDYGMLADAGVKCWVPEAQAAVIETEGWNGTDIPMPDSFSAMMLRVSACNPDCSLALLNCVKDGMEQYNVIRHAPAFMASDIYGIAECLCNGRRAVSGMMTCLADGIRQSEWYMLDSIYRNAFRSVPSACLLPAVVWSDSAFANEFSAYFQKTRCSSFTLLARLLSRGCVIPESIAVQSLEKVATRPLLVLYPEYYDVRELEAVRAASDGNYAEITCVDDGRICLRIYRSNEVRKAVFAEMRQGSYREISDWRQPLDENLPENAFFEEAADLINALLSPIRPFNQQDRHVRIRGYRNASGDIELFIGNVKSHYARVAIAVEGTFTSADIDSDDFALPPVIQNQGDMTVLGLKLPPNGTIPLTLKR